MKSCFSIARFLFFLVGLLFCPQSVQAQAENGGGARLSFLSAADRDHFLKVHHQVMESQPDLKTQQQNLIQQWKTLKGQGTSATPEDKQSLRQNFKTLNEKMNAAMLQADPSIAPVLEQIKAHRKEKFEQHAAGGGDDSST